MKKRGHLNGERYCGNFATKTVHDLLNEQKECFIDSVINSGDEIPFISLDIALKVGYSCCEYCRSID